MHLDSSGYFFERPRLLLAILFLKFTLDCQFTLSKKLTYQLPKAMVGRQEATILPKLTSSALILQSLFTLV